MISSTWLYILNMRKKPFDDAEQKSLRSWVESDYSRKRNLHNDYLIDRQLQRTRLYSGIQSVNAAEQDGCATETMGPISIAARNIWAIAIKPSSRCANCCLDALSDLAEGKHPPHVIRR